MFTAHKMYEPMTRVMNSKARIDEVIDGVKYNDENAIREFCREVYPKSGQIGSPDQVWQFNTALVQVAYETIVKPNLQQVLGQLAITETVDANTSLKIFTIDQDTNIKFSLSARGTGAKLNKIGRDRKVVQVPFNASLGLTYSVLTKTEDEVEWFRKATAKIGDALVRFIYTRMMTMAKTSGVIPGSNVIDTAGGATYNAIVELGRKIKRRTNCTPALLGDEIMLDYVAGTMATTLKASDLITDPVRKQLFEEYGCTNFGKFVGMPLVNPYTTDANDATKLEFNPEEAFMFGAGDSLKPFAVTLIGGLVQKTNADIVDGEVAFWAEQEMAITTLYGNRIGYIKDDNVLA